MNYPLDDGHVLVVGSAGVDVKGCPVSPVTSGEPVPGHIRSSVGGVARNIAENLARLEVSTILLTAVGDDAPGHRVLERCRDAGIDISHTQVIPDGRTGHYIAMLTPEGVLDLAISDYDISRHIDVDYLEANRDLFSDASLVVIDAGLEDDTLKKLFDMAQAYDVPVCADPTSPALAERLRAYLKRVSLIAPNIEEAAILCQEPIPPRTREAGLQMAQCLLERGVKTAVVTLGINGLVYASSAHRGHIPAIRVEIVDETGAGDALTSAVIFGLLNEVPLDEALRLGVSAASLTVQSSETVLPELSQELLYNELVI